jgi:hypothetical protein
MDGKIAGTRLARERREFQRGSEARPKPDYQRTSGNPSVRQCSAANRNTDSVSRRQQDSGIPGA